MADLERAIALTRDALQAIPDNHPDRATYLKRLGNRLTDKYWRTKEMAFLEEAIAVAREAVKAALSYDRQNQARFLYNLSVGVGSRYLRTGAMVDLEEAISIAREAIKTMPGNHPDQARLLTNLGIRLDNRYSCTGAITDLEEAITVARQAIHITPENHNDQAKLLVNLGIRLGHRFLRTGTMEDLEEAITVTREATNAVPKNHPDQARLLNNLAARLSDRFARTGAIEDVKEAISVTREAIKATPNDYTDQARLMNNLGVRLNNRYSRTGAMSDLEEAISFARDAIQATPDYHKDRPKRLNNLGIQLRRKYSRTGAISDLEESIVISREALIITPENHPDRAKRLNNLAAGLNTRYAYTSAVSDLEAAIAISKEAALATPQDHPDWAGRLNNLAVDLNDRYLKTGNMADIETAITLARVAIDSTPDNHPERAMWLNSLGARLRDRYSRTAAIADIEEARLRFRQALDIKEATIDERLWAGRMYLSLPNLLQQTQEAYAVAETAVNLIPLLTSLALQSTDKRHRLRQFVGLASNAAAIALHAGHTPSAALQLLETGRGVLAESLQNIRADISHLQQQYPDLAHEFIRLRDQIDAPALQTNLELSQTPTTPNVSDPDRRHKASDQMQQLLDNIRSRAGFERFFMSPTEEDMREIAIYGPIVVINVSPHRCDALIVEGSDISDLSLPQLTLEGIKEHARELGSVTTLEWLWDVVVGPVLNFLGFTKPPTGDTWPRIWWIPTGPLVRFPLHGSGFHTRRNAETALDRVISSYSSSIKSMLHTRQQRCQDMRPTSSLKVVLVDMLETPCMSRLSYAKVEIDAVQDVCESIGLQCSRPSTWKKDVVAALDHSQILHFAGHGGTCPDPLQSLLLLTDWENDPLTVECLLETNLSANAPFLAYLSACGTGRILDESSVDESLHLASAFQLAGFRHVIGTLWEVDDQLCVDMAKLVYDYMGNNRLNDESVSRGLHHSAKRLRDEWLEEQTGVETNPVGYRDVEMDWDEERDQPLWVPYVHFGV